MNQSHVFPEGKLVRKLVFSPTRNLVQISDGSNAFTHVDLSEDDAKQVKQELQVMYPDEVKPTILAAGSEVVVDGDLLEVFHTSNKLAVDGSLTITLRRKATNGAK